MIRRSRANLVSKTRNDRTAGKQPKEWMTSGEVARALSMTDAAIRRWAREGLIEAIKTPGGQYRFSRQALARLLQVKHHNNGSATKSPKRKRTRS
jgi:excisionase family DNA binding protein